MKKITDKQLIEIGKETLLMAVREQLMQYYKGSCVGELASNPWVQLQRVGRSSYLATESDGTENFYYRRREFEQARPTHLLIADRMVAYLQLQPDEFTFKAELGAEIETKVTKFFEDYLPSVQLKQDKQPNCTISDSIYLEIAKYHFDRSGRPRQPEYSYDEYTSSMEPDESVPRPRPSMVWSEAVTAFPEGFYATSWENGTITSSSE